MQLTTLITALLAGASSLAVTSAGPIDDASLHRIHRRTSPSGSYAPANVSCPMTTGFLRPASGLSPNETEWLQLRRQNVQEPLENLLSVLAQNSSSINTTALAENSTIGLAFSGGGYRAMIVGGGFLSAMDSRTPGQNSSNPMSGIMQAASYIVGLSGGNWLVGGLAINNFPTIEEQWHTVWDLETNLVNPSGIVDKAQFYYDLIDEVNQKSDAGFETTITDYWGRALSRHLVNTTDGGPAITFSDIRNRTLFANGSMPFPISLADGRAPGETAIAVNTSTFEFNPFEMGSWDNDIAAFTPIQYLGTSLNNGSLIYGDGSCIEGFDNAGFVMGTSSSLFNAALLQINGSDTSILTDAAEAILSRISADEEDIAAYPNPFYGWKNSTNLSYNSTRLTLVDGGEDNQNIPFLPLLQPERNVDVIFAVDASADTAHSWPNGSSLVNTYRRLTVANPMNDLAFPYVPDYNTFINLGLNVRPTFFGCNSSNLTTEGTGPLVVYLPNAPYTAYSNTSTFMLEYQNDQVADILTNAYNVASRANSTLDSEWNVCLACAIAQRSAERQSIDISSACSGCFDRYCWDGSLNATEPTEAELTPTLMWE
ncbi:hypothetical protein G7K_3449-t1 [Saitoella complicata NRRL Y-17804]|uniref:Lysophospholipase n=1 Tax=Saitoella complicata (strain BCRC 22490 / CBS 7301 / JCM 7358 / NBRC 10748 / NRRL Y-17804) TaxID=698492 RepID=A0A0E9NHK0_SAICN|nr:hypothetical protein G7K_3449-t1 [Saitoella complicata NRRL Y-17804]